MKRKRKNLQPWLDYFGMLQTYEEKGFLQMEPEKHEAYITMPALITLATGRDDAAAFTEIARIARGQMKAARRIRAYGGWRSQEGSCYLRRSFALHVVAADAPHDLLYTLLITSRRRWWSLWLEVDDFEVINYVQKTRP